MSQTIETRLKTVEKSVAELTATLLRLTPVRKDWLAAAGKLRDTPLAREADRLGSKYRAEQNKQ